MPNTTVVFVHGFVSNAGCWDPFFKQLNKDIELIAAGFRFARYQYPTSFLEIDVTKRIPAISECGNGLDTFLETRFPEGKLMLVGHSMGGLVIQSYLAEKIKMSRGKDLARVRSVILFATPNRGSTMLGALRGIFDFFRSNPQEQQLKVLDEAIADLNDTIVRSVLGAKCVDRDCCPIPFRVFWGEQDKVVPEASARGPFVEASALPGGHSEVIQCDANDPDDPRYLCLREALLRPVGHPSIYEIDRFEVTLAIMPLALNTTVVLRDLDHPITIQPGNAAIRSIEIDVAKQNRCGTPYEQTYRSEQGYVQSLGFTEPNQVLPEIESENRATGRKFTYVFHPDRAETFRLDLKIYNGFGDGQRSWHNHMKANAHYRLFRMTLNLKAFHDAGYTISPEPNLYFYDQNIADHKLCALRELRSPLPALPTTAAPWLRTWEVPEVYGGVLDVVWDLVPPA